MQARHKHSDEQGEKNTLEQQLSLFLHHTWHNLESPEIRRVSEPQHVCVCGGKCEDSDLLFLELWSSCNHAIIYCAVYHAGIQQPCYIDVESAVDPENITDPCDICTVQLGSVDTSSMRTSHSIISSSGFVLLELRLAVYISTSLRSSNCNPHQ